MNASHIEDYRPLTILNTDFKLVTRNIANRLRPWTPDLLQNSQHCGLTGNSVFQAIATTRDAVAYAEVTRTPLCVLSIDFQGAFDNLSHEYLFELLCKYGFSERFRKRMWSIYNNPTSSVQVNGYRSYPFPIKSSIRQGCPLSVILFAMCLNALLLTLDNSLHGLRIGRHRARASVVAYADDVTISITGPTDKPKLQEAIHCYEAASGARVNFPKSRAIAFGSCEKSLEIMNIPYSDTATILCFQIKRTVRESALDSWTKTTAKIRSQAQEDYCRMLTLDKRIQFVHEYLLARAWCVSQIYPPPGVCVRQLNTTNSSFVWKGDIFLMPVSALYRPKEDGGWDINLLAKSHALLLYRMRQQVMKPETIMAAWMRTWGLYEQGTNSPYRDIIPENLEYLLRFAMDSAYVVIQETMESKRAYKRRLYSTLYHISRGATDEQEMRITKIWPTTDWKNVWKNIHRTPVSGGMKAAWCKVINDTLPTNDRLHKIRMSPTDKCSNCCMHDTVQHRLIECGEGPQIWKWTTQKVVHILRTTPNRTPSDRLLCPQRALWPHPRRRAVMWILANVVFFRT